MGNLWQCSMAKQLRVRQQCALIGATAREQTQKAVTILCALEIPPPAKDFHAPGFGCFYEETGKMQLVKVEDHDRTQGGAAHTGGKALWGSSYSIHETSTTAETDATQYSTSDKEAE